MISKLRVKSFFFLLFISFFILQNSLYIIPVFSESLEESEKKLQEIHDKIKETQEQLDKAKTQEKTLKTQLTYIDAQTELTLLKAEEATAQVEKLTREIDDLSGRITRLSTTVDSMTKLLLNRIIQTYKYGNYSSVDLLFSSKGFSDFLLRSKYVAVAQANDKKVLYQIQATKSAYNDQKIDRESRQAQQEKLKKDLQVYQHQLDEQKKAKEQFLRVTKNDEEKYQTLIEQLKAEQDSIARAIGNIQAVVGPVTKGQVVASMGSTGCSTGPHLHYEVFENAKVEGGGIVGNRVNPHNYLDNGKLGAPLRGYPDETMITTEYGEVYFLGTHTGIDIAPKVYEGTGRGILASDNGIAYSTSAPCGSNIPRGTSVGKGIIIDHQNGLVTLYWHIL